MSCTHDCGCTPETRDARTDEWVQIAPESARDATLTPEQPVKAPGQDGDLLLTRGTVVEAEVARLTAERDAAIERLERVIDQWRKTGRAVISEMNRAERAEAERDALAAQVARVESLAEEWSTELDENRCPAHAFPGCDCHEGYHHAWDDLRAALAGPTALDAMGADQ